MNLYHFHQDYGRAGDIYGIFIVSDEGEKILRALVGMEIDFGEALGRKSETVGVLYAEELIRAEATDEEILTVCRVLREEAPVGGRRWTTISGYNPLDYIGETGIDWDALLLKAGVDPDPSEPVGADEF